MVEISINGKTNRRPKKRSFKSRGDQQSFNTFINQMSTIDYRLCDVIAPSKVNDKYGKVLFPYVFTKYFQIHDDHKPTPIRIHVMSKASESHESWVHNGGFSFMLGGPQMSVWGKEDAFQLLKEQVSLYAQHLKCDSVLRKMDSVEWQNISISCRQKLDKDGIRHMIIFWPIDTEENPKYICIHDDITLDAKMNVSGHYYW